MIAPAVCARALSAPRRSTDRVNKDIDDIVLGTDYLSYESGQPVITTVAYDVHINMCNGQLKRGGLVLILLLGSVPSNLRNHEFRNRSLVTQQLLASLVHAQRNTILSYTKMLTRRGRNFHRL